MKRILFVIILFAYFTVSAQDDTTQQIISGRTNSLQQQAKPYVILISADGFRYDYAAKYNAKNLLRLSDQGIRAESMTPVFPSLTFPNHYSIVTGLYPAHNGQVGNSYYDRNKKDMYTMSNRKMVEDGSRYGGTPLWVLAEKQQMLTASFYWVGSEANIQGIHPTYYYKYSEVIPIQRRIDIVIEWLKKPEDVRPHLITFYFPEVDHAGHDYGPDAPETKAAVLFVDSAIGKLNEAISALGLPVNFLLVSDHGMTNVNVSTPIHVAASIDTTKFILSKGGQILQLYAHNREDIKPAYKQAKREARGYDVYLKNRMPKRFHYRTKDDYYNKIGDIIFLPQWPNVFSYSNRKISPGAHGFDATRIKDMHATFYAWGPSFNIGLKIPSFKNIHVYPVVTSILGLQQSSKIDANYKIARKILK